MKEKLLKLLAKIKEQELYLSERIDSTISKSENEIFIGKWYEVQKIRKELEEILNEEA